MGNLYRTGPDDNAAANYFLAIFLGQVQSALELPLALFGNGSNLIGGCSIGGVRVSCSLAYSVLNSGGPRVPNASDISRKLTRTRVRNASDISGKLTRHTRTERWRARGFEDPAVCRWIFSLWIRDTG